MFLDLGGLALGGIILYLGAEWLVKGAAGLARAFGVAPLVIGLTVVAYATSAPELAVSSAAILDDSSAMALGNIVGSCIANLALILGATALLSPPHVDGRLIRREVPLLVLSVIAVPVTLLDGEIGRIDAAVLAVISVLFTVLTLRSARSMNAPTAAEAEEDAEIAGAPAGGGKLRLSLITAVGLVLLIGGGEVFVRSASSLAIALGMSERLVGLTIVAVGTSLPELAACVVAAMRGHSSLAVGNVVGSNIFNVFLILGVVGLIRPIHGDLGNLRLDLYFLAGVTAFGVLVMRGERKISRVEGTLLVATYIAFVTVAVVNNVQ